MVATVSMSKSMKKMPDLSKVATGDRLGGILEGLAPFNEKMRLEASARWQKNAQKITPIIEEMERLAGVLDAEVKKNEEDEILFRQKCDQAIAKAEETFFSLLDHQSTRADERISAMEKQADEIEVYFSTHKKDLLQNISDRNNRLSNLLDQFETDFAAEIEDRRKRESEIEEQLKSREIAVQKRFRDEQPLRDEIIRDFKKELAHIIASRDNGNQQLQATCLKQITHIEKNLERELQQRKLFDDKILIGLNQYSQKLQSSLHIINNDDDQKSVAAALADEAVHLKNR